MTGITSASTLKGPSGAIYVACTTSPSSERYRNNGEWSFISLLSYRRGPDLRPPNAPFHNLEQFKEHRALTVGCVSTAARTATTRPMTAWRAATIERGGAGRGRRGGRRWRGSRRPSLPSPRPYRLPRPCLRRLTAVKWRTRQLVRAARGKSAAKGRWTTTTRRWWTRKRWTTRKDTSAWRKRSELLHGA